MTDDLTDRAAEALIAHRCPHPDVRFCPLYIAAHWPGSFGCDDGRLGEGGCAVDRGLSYVGAVAALRAAQPRLVAEAEFAADHEALIAQRKRNMRAAGIH